ncbi:transposase, partial [Methylocystis sp. MJC1]|uniref:transposase n=1 Tax=Methylocystis sp. MJC1 TaxID=2654282 RepID=UPI001FEE3ECD
SGAETARLHRLRPTPDGYRMSEHYIHWFQTLAEARCLIEAWRIDYNESRRHMALGNIPPSEYALRAVSSTA